MKMSAKSNKVELNEEFIDMWKEEQSPEVFSQETTSARVSFLIKLQASRNF